MTQKNQKIFEEDPNMAKNGTIKPKKEQKFSENESKQQNVHMQKKTLRHTNKPDTSFQNKN